MQATITKEPEKKTLPDSSIKIPPKVAKQFDWWESL